MDWTNYPLEENECRKTQKAFRLKISLSKTNLCQNIFNCQRELYHALEGNKKENTDWEKDEKSSVRNLQTKNTPESNIRKKFDPEDEYDLNDEFVDDSDLFFGEMNYIPPRKWDHGFFAWHGQIEDFFRDTLNTETTTASAKSGTKSRRKKIKQEQSAIPDFEKKSHTPKSKVPDQENTAQCSQDSDTKKTKKRDVTKCGLEADSKLKNKDAPQVNAEKQNKRTTLKHTTDNENHEAKSKCDVNAKPEASLNTNHKKKKSHPEENVIPENQVPPHENKPECDTGSLDNKSTNGYDYLEHKSTYGDSSIGASGINPAPIKTVALLNEILPDPVTRDPSLKRRDNNSPPKVTKYLRASTSESGVKDKPVKLNGNSLPASESSDQQYSSPSTQCSTPLRYNNYGDRPSLVRKRTTFYPPDYHPANDKINAISAKIYSVPEEDIFGYSKSESRRNLFISSMHSNMQKLREISSSDFDLNKDPDALFKIQRKFIHAVATSAIKAGMFDNFVYEKLKEITEIQHHKLKILIIEPVARHLKEMQEQVEHDYSEFEALVSQVLAPQIKLYNKKLELWELNSKKPNLEKKLIPKPVQKFIWTDRLRYLFWRLINEEWIIAKWYNSLSFFKNNNDKYTKQGVIKAINEKILVFWPNNWMSSEQLFRVYEVIVKKINEQSSHLGDDVLVEKPPE